MPKCGIHANPFLFNIPIPLVVFGIPIPGPARTLHPCPEMA